MSNPIDHAEFTVDATVATFDTAWTAALAAARLLHSDMNRVVVHVVTGTAAGIRYTTDGTTPTASVGVHHPSNSLDPITLKGGDIDGFSCIREAATDAEVVAQFYAD